MQLNSYLYFEGTCEAAFKFYAKCLGGKIEAMLTHESAPADHQIPADWHKKILHARLTVGDQVLMGSDAPPGHWQKAQGFSVNIQVDKPAEADRVFGALAESAKATIMPIQETFWALRFGMLIDQFGTPWMVNCQKAT